MDKHRKRSLARTPTSITFASEMDLKDYEEHRRSLKGRFQEFCNDTSFTPISHVYKAGSTWKKFVWVVVSLGLTGYMTYQCHNLVVKYYKYPSEVDIELAFSPELDFPSVTICNLNPIRKNAVENSIYAHSFRALEDDGSEDVLYKLARNRMEPGGSGESSQESTEADYWKTTYWPEGTTNTGTNLPEVWTTQTNSPTAMPPSAGQPPGGSPPLRRKKRSTINGTSATNFTALISNSTYNQWAYLDEDAEESFYNKIDSQHQAMEMVSDIIAKMDKNLVEQMGHQSEDFIMGCRWQGYPCSPKNFSSFVNYKYGNCFTFNALINSSIKTPELKTSNPGPLYGLELELFIEQEEYTPSVTQEAGARVVIHSRGKIPFPEDEGFTISPGFLTSIGMRKTFIQRLPDPHGNCTANFDNQNSLYAGRGTVYSKPACTKSCFQSHLISQCNCGLNAFPLPANVSVCKANETHCKNDIEFRYKSNDLGCDEACPPPCEEEAFSLTISNAVWPSWNYENDLRSRMMKSSTKLMSAVARGESTGNVAKLEIFYQELNYQRIEQKPSYEFENMLSDLGGQLGLWLGVSVLALGEILDFFMSAIHFCLFKMSTAKVRDRGSTPIQPYRPPKE